MCNAFMCMKILMRVLRVRAYQGMSVQNYAKKRKSEVRKLE